MKILQPMVCQKKTLFILYTYTKVYLFMKLYDYFSILGFVRTRLFKVDVPSEFPRDSQNLEIRHKIDLPPDDTTYWCSTHKLPNIFRRKHHAVQVSTHIKKV